MNFLTLDLGGSHAACSLVRGEQVLATEHLSFADATQLSAVLPEIVRSLQRLGQRAEGLIGGLGIGMPGIIDSRRNQVLSTNGKYEDAKSFDFDAWGREALGLPVRVENDARLALRGELAAGAARGCTDVVMFTLGTGIGGVVAMDGKPLVGIHGQAGLLCGHVVVREQGRKCNCGGQGCAEAEASGWALPMLCKEWPGFHASALADLPRNFKSVFDCADAGDEIAVAIRDHCLRIWAMMTVTAVHSFDPELIVFGGGVMAAADRILPFLQQYVDANTWTHWGKPPIVAAKLESQAAALGVASLFEEEGR